MRRSLAAVGAQPRAATDLLIAVGEACSNAVEHPYGPADGIVTVHVELHSPDVVAVVRDRGRWRSPRAENRGRGKLIMRAYADDLRVNHDASGTEVVIRRRLAEVASR